MSGKRADHRAAQTAAIKATAKSQLAISGPAALSLREVARTLHLSSSAIYRYFRTRDDLLTALILDAYNDLGDAVSSAEAAVERPAVRERFLVTVRAIRSWALAHPHEYALIFGTPVPGYHAPEETIAAASRVTMTLGTIIRDHQAHAPEPTPRWTDMLEWDALQHVTGRASPDMVVEALATWTMVFGLLSFELFGHFVGSVTNNEQFFEVVMAQRADVLGLLD